MTKKGMSMTMEIIIVVIILLVAAMVVLSIFGMQMGGIAQIMGTWISGVPAQPQSFSCTAGTLEDCRKAGIGCISCCSGGAFTSCAKMIPGCPTGTSSC